VHSTSPDYAQVFLHDPLLDWQLSTKKIAKARPPKPRSSSGGSAGAAASGKPGGKTRGRSREATPPAATAVGGDGEDGGGDAADEDAPPQNLDAKHAVDRVGAKLRGLDFQDGEPLSVEGTVEQLIQQATDPARLCRLFVGWSSWV
jgi:phosphatidylinositol kinase/protein kinase (PI-3  family)